MPRKKKAAPVVEPTDTNPPDPATPTDEPPSSPDESAVPDAGPGNEPSHAGAVRPNGPSVPNPFSFKHDVAAGVRLMEDRRFKQMQIQFAEKPSDDIRLAVREAGFRWLQEEQVWVKQIDRENGWQTRADAEKLFDQIASQIRAEKGIRHEVG